MDVLMSLGSLGIFVALILLGLIAGSVAERSHLRSLERREQELAAILVTDVKSFPGGARPATRAHVVMGQAVIATDYLKSFLAGLRKIVGGEVRSYLSLMTRARREAVVRMLEDARDKGYDAVCNVRINTADIGGATARKGATMVGVFVTGTAYLRH